MPSQWNEEYKKAICCPHFNQLVDFINQKFVFFFTCHEKNKNLDIGKKHLKPRLFFNTFLNAYCRIRKIQISGD